ncbi:MAG: hypothetical protein H6Q08_1091 [Acidobacteria bacterium]|nr:hypothetical protein [Acidobacteriota bacterium]
MDRARTSDHAPTAFWLALAGVYTAIAVFLTWPQAAEMSSVPVHHDTLFSVWRIAWVAHQVVRDPLHLFDANIFFPEPRTLAYSDAILLQGLASAPFIWVGVPPVVVYNALVLISFVACGLGMALLAHELTHRREAALLAGIVFGFAPFRFDHLMHLELLWAPWMPLACWALHRVFESGRRADGRRLGLFAALQLLSCIYYGVFLVTILAVIGVVLALGIARSRRPLPFRPVAVAAMVVSLVALPYMSPYVANAKRMGERSLEDTGTFSARVENYLSAPAWSTLWGWTFSRHGDNERQLFPGAIALGLAVIGAAPPFSATRVAYVVATIVAVDGSLGVNGHVYPFLRRHVFVYRGLRVPARFGMATLLGVAVLAALGTARLARAIAAPFGRRGTAVLTMVLAAGMLGEYLVFALPMERLPTKAPAAYRWLAEQPGGTVLEWPLPGASALPGKEARYQYSSIFHWKPLANGYSGAYPTSYIDFIERMQRLPDQDTVGLLRDRSVRYLLIHTQQFDSRELRDRLDGNDAFQFVGYKMNGIDPVAVYLVHNPGHSPSGAGGGAPR